MPLALNDRGHTVKTACDGTELVHQAGVVPAEQRTADAIPSGFPHDLLVARALPGALVIMPLEAGGPAVGLARRFENGRALRAEIETFVELAVNIHGLDQGKVEHGVAAVAAPGLAAYFRRELIAHAPEQSVGLSHQFFIRQKHGVQSGILHMRIFHAAARRRGTDNTCRRTETHGGMFHSDDRGAEGFRPGFTLLQW